MVNDNQKYFVFNGKKSSDFDVWVSGLNIFRSPGRRIERIQVPGRNGELLIEDGSFENVELEFKDCFIPNHFSENFTNLSNYLNRQKGYQRLELSWLPDEYRLAAFHGGIEATLKNWDGRGKFDLTFNCKPQRFLKSGEGSISIPCDPAASPAGARRYWRLSQFTEFMQTEITGSLSDQYTTAEINAMQFEVITIPQTSLDWLASLGDHFGTLEFKGVNTDRFFAFLYSNDPTTAESQSEYSTDETVTGWNANRFGGSLGNNYIVLKKSFGTEVYYDGRKIAQDETYQMAAIENPTQYDAMPKIRIEFPHNMNNLAGATVYMAGVGQNGVSLTWDETLTLYTDCIVTIDSELMDVYILPEDNVRNGVIFSLNKYAKFYGDRIKFEPGENTIRLDPMIVSCEIVPRWWQI